MIAYAMLYAAAVGVPVLLAAWALASVLRRSGRPERLVWLGGLLLAFVLPALALLQGRVAEVASEAPAAAGTTTGVIGLPEIVVVTQGPVTGGLTGALAVLWAAASLLLAARLVVAALRLARAGRSWHADTIDGVRVWLTERIGPAVSGLLRPRVLVPTWAARMPAHQRSLVLLHEQEHIRAGDPWLMLVSRVAPVLVPWNPVVWMLSARLLRAIELDCDRRVLRHRPDVRTYGHTLIEISSRDRGRLVAVAAFAESEAPLRSRILNMTTPSRTISIVALLTSMVLGVVLLVAAFEIPVPTIRTELSIGPDPGPATVIDAPGRVDGPDAADAAEAERRERFDAQAAAETDRREPTEAELAAAADAQRLRERLTSAQEEIARLRAERERGSEVAVPRTQIGIRDDPESGFERSLDEVSAEPTFTPFTVAPQLLNIPEVQAALAREYPTVLRDSGIGGRVLVWFLIDAEGLVRRTLINESSGYEALDQAALNVADVYRFSPAMNREYRTAVWVALPITFQVR